MSSSSTSCSHWWHAPIYIAATVALIVAAISSSPSLQNDEIDDGDLILALHRSGFHLTALTLHFSPTLSLASPFTLFALPDSALADLTLPAADHLLRSHASPLALPLSDLPLGSPIAVPTLSSNNLTLIVAASAAVNGVPITHPDLFGGLHVVHGVAGRVPGHYEPKIAVRWARVARALASRGYVSFSVGLSSVHDSLPPMLDLVTVFAPRNDGGMGTAGFDYVAAPAVELERAIRRHVVVGRLRGGEMRGMGEGEVKEMRTLLEEEEEERRVSIVSGGKGKTEVNGVEVVEAEVYVDDGVVVHGVAMVLPAEFERE